MASVILCNLCVTTLFSQDRVFSHQLPRLDNQKLQDKHSTAVVDVYQFAQAHILDLDIKNDANWSSTKDGKLEWTKSFTSKDAFSINFGFTTFTMPENGSVLFYNPDKSDIKGPFTKEDMDAHGQLWTPIIKGETVIIEVKVPEEAFDKMNLILHSINHDFVGFGQRAPVGSCHVDTRCGENQGYKAIEKYRDVIQSVGAYHFNGILACSGTLINNTENDCTPFFLTAEHCEVNPATAPTVVVYWNYQNTYCRLPNSVESGEPGDGSLNEYNTGAIFRAASETSDFALMELDDPLNPAHKLYLAGWDLDLNLPKESAMIHHPGVKEKRITLDYDAAIHRDGLEGSFVRVENWEAGSSEDGSSGGALFNTNQQIIGQLFGGKATCSNNSYDDFGWIKKSWNGNNSINSSLHYWLDPNNKSNNDWLGMACGYAIEMDDNQLLICSDENNTRNFDLNISPFFSGQVDITVENIDNLDFVLSKTKADPGETIDLQLNNVQDLNPGEYLLRFKAKNGTEIARRNIYFSISNNTPTVPILIYPSNQQFDIPLTPLFEFASNEDDKVFRVQIANDSLFNQVAFDFEIEKNGVQQPFELQGSQFYFWRTKALNNCGESDWSAVSMFKTKTQFCATLFWNEGPLLIPETSGVVIAEINNPHDAVIESIKIPSIKGTHSYIGDLEFRLSHNNIESTLWSTNCGSDDDFNFGFNENVANLVSCPPDDGITYKPEESLFAFQSMQAKGIWSLAIEDFYNQDGGWLDSYELEFCFVSVNSNSFIPNQDFYKICKGNALYMSCFLSLPDLQNVNISVLDENGQLVNADIDHSNLLADQTIGITLNNINGNVGDVLDYKIIASNNATSLVREIKIESIEEAQEVILDEPSPNVVFSKNELIVFEWQTMAMNEQYEVQISADSTFSDIDYIEFTTLDYILLEDVILPGSYFYRILSTNENQCTAYSEVRKFEVSQISSTHTILNDRRVKIYPNPASNQFKVESIKGNIKGITVFDCQGKAVLSKAIDDDSSSFDCSFMVSGLYFVKVEIDDIQIIKRIQILH